MLTVLPFFLKNRELRIQNSEKGGELFEFGPAPQSTGMTAPRNRASPLGQITDANA